jgi:hypothetical protein
MKKKKKIWGNPLDSEFATPESRFGIRFQPNTKDKCGWGLIYGHSQPLSTGRGDSFRNCCPPKCIHALPKTASALWIARKIHVRKCPFYRKHHSLLVIFYGKQMDGAETRRVLIQYYCYLLIPFSYVGYPFSLTSLVL